MASAWLHAVALDIQALLQAAGAPSAFSGQWTAGGTPATPGKQGPCTLSVTSGALLNHSILLVDSGAAQEVVWGVGVAGPGPYTASFITTLPHVLPCPVVVQPFYQVVYLDEPQSFGGQSPVAVIVPPQTREARYTMGAGVNRATESWRIETYIDRTQQPAGTAGVQLLQAMDVLRSVFQQHVQLGDGSGSILMAGLDGESGRPAYRVIESSLYRWFSCGLHVTEEYVTPIGA